MEQLNRAEVIGYIGTMRTNQVGERMVCNFSVATNAIVRNSETGVAEETTWHNCCLWSSRRIPDLSFLKVGIPVHVVGRIRTNKYTGSDGVDRTSSEIIVGDIELLPDGTQLSAANLA